MQPALLQDKCVLVEDNVVYDSDLNLIAVDDSSLTILSEDNLLKIPKDAHKSLLDCIGQLFYISLDRNDHAMFMRTTKLCDLVYEMIRDHIHN